MTDECYMDDEADRGRTPDADTKGDDMDCSGWGETWTIGDGIFRNKSAKLDAVKSRLQKVKLEYPEPSVMIPAAFLHMFVDYLLKLIEK